MENKKMSYKKCFHCHHVEVFYGHEAIVKKIRELTGNSDDTSHGKNPFLMVCLLNNGYRKCSGCPHKLI